MTERPESGTDFPAIPGAPARELILRRGRVQLLQGPHPTDSEYPLAGPDEERLLSLLNGHGYDTGVLSEAGIAVGRNRWYRSTETIRRAVQLPLRALVLGAEEMSPEVLDRAGTEVHRLHHRDIALVEALQSQGCTPRAVLAEMREGGPRPPLLIDLVSTWLDAFEFLAELARRAGENSDPEPLPRRLPATDGGAEAPLRGEEKLPQRYSQERLWELRGTMTQNPRAEYPWPACVPPRRSSEPGRR